MNFKCLNVPTGLRNSHNSFQIAPEASSLKTHKHAPQSDSRSHTQHLCVEHRWILLHGSPWLSFCLYEPGFYNRPACSSEDNASKNYVKLCPKVEGKQGVSHHDGKYSHISTTHAHCPTVRVTSNQMLSHLLSLIRDLGTLNQ